jgi:hypothetical protein
MPATEPNMSPSEILALLSDWIRRKLTPRPPLSYRATPAMLENLRQALRDNATPVDAAPTPPPDSAFLLQSAARSSEIVGHMLDTMSGKYSFMKKPAAFFVSMGRVSWGVVEAAMPRSIYNLLMHYWFSLLLIVEIVIIAGGTFITSDKSVQPLGVKLLVLTLVFRAVIELVRLYIGHMRFPRTVLGLIVLVVFALLWRGVVHVQDDDIPAIERKLQAAKQSTACKWLRCESAKPAAK